jgi:hypothetical protein
MPTHRKWSGGRVGIGGRVNGVLGPWGYSVWFRFWSVLEFITKEKLVNTRNAMAQHTHAISLNSHLLCIAFAYRISTVACAMHSTDAKLKFDPACIMHSTFLQIARACAMHNACLRQHFSLAFAEHSTCEFQCTCAMHSICRPSCNDAPVKLLRAARPGSQGLICSQAQLWGAHMACEVATVKDHRVLLHLPPASCTHMRIWAHRSV